jgi:hypothetical protein
MDLALSSRHGTGDQRLDIALGWMITRPSEMLFHGGGTGGFRTAMALDRVKRRGVVVLTNSAVEPSADDLAIHMMIGTPVATAGKVPPPPPPPRVHGEIKLPPAQLDKVVGTYEILPTLQLKVWRDGDGLMAQMSGAPPFPIFAEAPLAFFWKVVNADVRFIEEDGKVTGAHFTQDGREASAKKLP